MLIDEVFRQRKPLLAICRGHQVLNVALGGTLVADILGQMPRAMNHRRMDRRSEIVHEVQLTRGFVTRQDNGQAEAGCEQHAPPGCRTGGRAVESGRRQQ